MCGGLVVILCSCGAWRLRNYRRLLKRVGEKRQSQKLKVNSYLSGWTLCYMYIISNACAIAETLELIDTTLLICYTKVCTPPYTPHNITSDSFVSLQSNNSTLIEYLVRLPDNHLNLAECEQVLENKGLTQALVYLYQSKGQHEKGLPCDQVMWSSVAMQPGHVIFSCLATRTCEHQLPCALIMWSEMCICVLCVWDTLSLFMSLFSALRLLTDYSKGPSSTGLEQTISYLQNLGKDNVPLILEYSTFVIKVSQGVS